jgi:hypothetical protein
MKLSKLQLERAVRHIIEEWKKENLVTFKVSEERILKRGFELLEKEVEKEYEIDREATRMMDDLERQNPGSFDRHKMFPMLKKRLAKERGVIL